MEVDDESQEDVSPEEARRRAEFYIKKSQEFKTLPNELQLEWTIPPAKEPEKPAEKPLTPLEEMHKCAKQHMRDVASQQRAAEAVEKATKRVQRTQVELTDANKALLEKKATYAEALATSAKTAEVLVQARAAANRAEAKKKEEEARATSSPTRRRAASAEDEGDDEERQSSKRTRASSKRSKAEEEAFSTCADEMRELLSALDPQTGVQATAALQTAPEPLQKLWATLQAAMAQTAVEEAAERERAAAKRPDVAMGSQDAPGNAGLPGVPPLPLGARILPSTLANGCLSPRVHAFLTPDARAESESGFASHPP